MIVKKWFYLKILKNKKSFKMEKSQSPISHFKDLPTECVSTVWIPSELPLNFL